MKNNILFFAFTGLLALYPVCAGWGQADTRYISEELNKIQRCKNMALTRNQGMVALFGSNGHITSGIPNTLYDKLKDSITEAWLLTIFVSQKMEAGT